MSIPSVKSNEDGQVMIEFLLVFMFGLGITFLFVNMSINYTVGFLNHYATFMASRTFLTSDQGSNSAIGNWTKARADAINTYNKYQLDQFGINPISNENVNMHTAVGGSQKAVFVGVTSNFKMKLSPFKTVGGSKKANFFSESYLGKEPVRITCLEQICATMGLQDCIANWPEIDAVLYDNGC